MFINDSIQYMDAGRAAEVAEANNADAIKHGEAPPCRTEPRGRFFVVVWTDEDGCDHVL